LTHLSGRVLVVGQARCANCEHDDHRASRGRDAAALPATSTMARMHDIRRLASP
jgi:hypothetical protein